MDETVTISYTLADGKEISVEVSLEVKEFLEQSYREMRSQQRQDRRYLCYMDYRDNWNEADIKLAKDTVDIIIEIEKDKRFRDAIDSLHKIQRRRLRLHFVDNLSYRQIASLEGVHHAAICDSIKRAINKLHQSLID